MTTVKKMKLKKEKSSQALFLTVVSPYCLMQMPFVCLQRSIRIFWVWVGEACPATYRYAPIQLNQMAKLPH